MILKIKEVVSERVLSFKGKSGETAYIKEIKIITTRGGHYTVYRKAENTLTSGEIIEGEKSKNPPYRGFTKFKITKEIE